MSKKFFSVFFCILFVSFLFVGCTDLINTKTQADIKINLDLSKIKFARNDSVVQGEQSATVSQEMMIKVSLYDVQNYNPETSSENLILITSSQSKIQEEKATIQLQNIPVGINAIIFAEICSSIDDYSSAIYDGNSEVFTVKQNNNKVKLVLKKVDVEIAPDGDDGSSGDGSDGDESDDGDDDYSGDGSGSSDGDDTTGDDNNNIIVEYFILYQKIGDEEYSKVENAVQLDSEYTKVVLPDVSNSNSLWTYYVKPANDNRFSESGNYKISVDLYANETTVVEVVGARADYFFTIDNSWKTYTFETGFIKGPTDHGISIALGLSAETHIRNLKVEKIADTSTLPTLSFYVTDYAIKNYLNKENIADQIIEVTKTSDEEGYLIKVNTPMSHNDSAGSVVQDVTLELRSYTDKSDTGLNMASFNMTSSDTTTNPLLISLEGSTISSSTYSTRWNTPSAISSIGEAEKVFFPSYEKDEECFIDGVFSGGTQDPTTVTISNFEIKKATDDEISAAGKSYVIKFDNTFHKCELGVSQIFTIPEDPVNFDVLFANSPDWGEDNTFTDGNSFDWTDCIRFFVLENENEILKSNIITHDRGTDSNGDYFSQLEAGTNAEISVSIKLTNECKVVIEEVDNTTTGSGGE